MGIFCFFAYYTDIQSDPEAAQELFSFPEIAEKIIMVPLELTNTALLTKAIERQILSLKPSRFRKMWIEILHHYSQQYFPKEYPDGPPVHDVCAVHIANLIGQGITASSEGRWNGVKMRCHVNTGKGTKRGQTVLKKSTTGKDCITVATHINVRKRLFGETNSA